MIICSRNTDTNRLSIDHMFKRKDDPNFLKLEPEDYLLKKDIVYNQLEGYLHCKFSRPKSVLNSRYVNDLTQPHFIHVARGTPGELMFDKLQSFQPSDSRIEFTQQIYVPKSSRSWLVKIHGIFFV